jgi:predicted P-loop ATPase
MARAYRPGCKADHVLVLEGRQGVGKTSTFEILGSDWHLPDIPRVDNKDARAALATEWIAEFSELAGLRSVEQQKIKSFITERVDKYRPPYGRNMLTRPRRCVFAGSTNEAEWIQDSTGGRRFWPVRVLRVDYKGLERDRDALLAEARNLYREGEIWHPAYEGELEAIIREQQATRVESDPWETVVADFVAAKHRLDPDYQPTLKEMFHVCGVAPEFQDRGGARRIATALRLSGWVKRSVKNPDGSKGAIWTKEEAP